MTEIFTTDDGKIVKPTDDSMRIKCPEESQILAESRALVEKAKQKMSKIDPKLIEDIRLKQAARTVLSWEADMVQQMLQEGLLTPAHAEELLNEIMQDQSHIEYQRTVMYRQQAALKAQQRSSLIRQTVSFASTHNPAIVEGINELNSAVGQGNGPLNSRI